MGNHFEISVVAQNEAWAFEKIALAVQEIKRIENLLTTYNDQSETYQINQMAGIAPVKVCAETFQLIQRSIKISEITQGAFDISYGSVDKRLWNFDATMQSWKHADAMKQSVIEYALQTQWRSGKLV